MFISMSELKRKQLALKNSCNGGFKRKKKPKIDAANMDTDDSDGDDVNKLKSCVADLTTCSICLESFKDPRSLPCLHTFCFGCLDNICDGIRPGGQVSCPVCRKVSKLPQNGALDFPHSFLIADLMTASESEDYCIKHSNRTAEIYCFTCKAVICHYCSTQGHSEHVSQRIRQAMQHFHNEMDAELVNVRLRAEDLRMKATALDKRKTAFVGAVEKVNVSIWQQGHELKNLVDKQVKHLQTELSEQTAGILSDIDAAKLDIVEKLEEIDCLVSKIEKVKSMESCCEMAVGADDICNEIQNVHQTPLSIINYRVPVVSFTPHVMDSKLEIGNISVTNLTATDELFSSTQTIMHANCIKTDTLICSIAYLDGRIYIGCKHSNRIDVYAADDGCRSNYRRLPGILIRGMSEASDIVAYQEDSCLFVVCSVNKCVWQVKPGDGMKEVWLSEADNNLHDFHPCTLSITACRSGLLLVDHQSLLVFEILSKSMRRIVLPNYMDPLHACETARDTFIVCYTDKNKGFGSVTEIDSNGNPLTSYVCGPGHGVAQLEWPGYAACLDNKHIFVLDFKTNQLLLFDSKLRLVSVVMRRARDDRNRTRRFCYDGSSGMLLVCINSRVLFYDMHFRTE